MSLLLFGDLVTNFFVTFKYTSIVLGSVTIIDIHTGTAEIYFTGYPITSLVEPNLCNGTL